MKVADIEDNLLKRVKDYDSTWAEDELNGWNNKFKSPVDVEDLNGKGILKMIDRNNKIYDSYNVVAESFGHNIQRYSYLKHTEPLAEEYKKRTGKYPENYRSSYSSLDK